ncbi:efflux RND transporter periplasmic adaptor subunit [Zhongshania aquimaris]|uniref:Efflux RND transporter periplasmic adaptor subunit n=1 Tax=Zhongshania aquimaris TaxID=2857107 RepID=A0ABS6VNQ6_9GAMM|nr:efflux RND transporter periplasmic adaptor subunit [Zhongshania aquimaris]MBW2939952.1 efflux RND transporter periplasmic adaptor subunit [Zhongshania aquimaris]
MNNSPRLSSSRKAVIWVVLLLLFVVGIWYLLGRTPPAPEQVMRRGWGGQTSSVRVVPVQKGGLDVQVRSIGTVTPMNTVVVRSRVGGVLDRIVFTEGSEVSKGDLLAVIDPAPYRAQFEQAQGQLQQNQAQLANAKVDLNLYQGLYAEDSIARQQLDSQAALVRELEGANKSQQAQLDDARLQLSWTRIEAPISGRLGLRRIDAGNLIAANDSEGLVTITQTHPIAVLFTVSEVEVPALVKAFNGGDSLRVEALNRNEQNIIATGKLVTLDNQIDTTTGTLRVRAEFENLDNSLFPNQFVNVRLRLNSIADALTIPADAVQHGSQGSYVYVVEDSKAYIRQITTGIVDSDRVAVIDGLQAGDRVVIEGLDRLRDGRDVTVDGDAPVPAAERRAGGAADSRSREGGKAPNGAAAGQRPNRDGGAAAPSPH